MGGRGRADLVVANIGDNNVSVLLGKGDGTFQASATYAAGVGPTTVVISDLNGDGLADIAVTNSGGNNVSVLLGNGDGVFQPPVNYSVGSDPLALVAADFNGDGRTDLAVGNYLDRWQHRRAAGSGRFQADHLPGAKRRELPERLRA